MGIIADLSCYIWRNSGNIWRFCFLSSGFGCFPYKYKKKRSGNLSGLIFSGGEKTLLLFTYRLTIYHFFKFTSTTCSTIITFWGLSGSFFAEIFIYFFFLIHLNLKICLTRSLRLVPMRWVLDGKSMDFIFFLENSGFFPRKCNRAPVKKPKNLLFPAIFSSVIFEQQALVIPAIRHRFWV